MMMGMTKKSKLKSNINLKNNLIAFKNTDFKKLSRYFLLKLNKLLTLPRL
jgi:hypothetical protein